MSAFGILKNIWRESVVGKTILNVAMESVPTSAQQEGLKNGLKITRVVKQLYKDKQSNLNYTLIYAFANVFERYFISIYW